jgi:hypothetical protein
VNQGFYLTLMMGSFNADPVPEAVIDALSSIQVTTTVGSQGGFQLKFTLGKNSAFGPLQASGFFDPRRRVIIAVTVNGTTEVLMDGIITKQDYTPSSAAGKSTFTVTGLDLTALMDFIDLTGIPYPGLPTFVAVELILAKYLVLGVVPVAIPPALSAISVPTDHIPKQQGTDYGYIQQLANEVGAVFYLDPGPAPGQSLAYWGPDLSKMFGGTQPALSVNMDANTNVDSLSFSYDGTIAQDFYVVVIEPHTHIPIPIPVPSLGAILTSQAKHAPKALKVMQLKPVAFKKTVPAALTVLGALLRNADVVTASGQLDVLRYGHVFKARQLCAVRGGGDYYDGLYYVKSVTHDIKRGEYKQSFTLARGGTGSSVATVAV